MSIFDVRPELAEKLLMLKESPERLSEFLDSLTSEERYWLLRVLKEIKEYGRSDTLRMIRSVDFIREPVSVREFLTPKYLGKFGYGIYKVWLDTLELIERNRVFEWIITGAIGCGKTSAARFMELYKLYLLSCLRDPSKYFGHLSGVPVVIGFYSRTREKADVYYSVFESIVREAPYFKECYSPLGKHGLDFPNRVSVMTGSSELHGLGDDLILLHIDEMNFMHGEGELSQAHKLYSSLRIRMLSRFLDKGINPGLLILISSRRSESDFLEKHIEEVKEEIRVRESMNLPAGVHISDFSLWEVTPERFSTKKFYVFVGSKTESPKVINNLEDFLKSVPEGDRDDYKRRIIEVPEDFRADFERDCERALRDLAGKATVAVSGLIKDKEALLSCFDGQDPFKKNPITISTKDRKTRIVDFLDVNKLCKVTLGSYVPRVNSNIPRCLHVDLGLVGDRAGICMGHAVPLEKGDYRYSTTNAVVVPFIIIDFILAISPPPLGEIDFQEIVNFICTLRDLGFTFDAITYDGWQSVHSRQLLLNSGFKNVSVLSVDRDDTPYRFARQALMEKRVFAPYHKICIEELLSLEHDIVKKKVDHPPGGSKDCADALAAVIYNCSLNVKVAPATSRDSNISTAIDSLISSNKPII